MGLSIRLLAGVGLPMRGNGALSLAAEPPEGKIETSSIPGLGLRFPPLFLLAGTSSNSMGSFIARALCVLPATDVLDFFPKRERAREADLSLDHQACAVQPYLGVGRIVARGSDRHMQ